ncbi:MAG: efflux RND transporter periplasmic adaptor subunit [Candidatus Rokubacteria bacterium]|nr:efflux RND transporter periplasmic adaptor subunit [Candidatus Rokubacteria bacterium]
MGFIVKDPQSGAVFTLGEREYFLCQQLDGRTSLDEVLARFRSRFQDPLSRESLSAFVRELAERGLLVGTEAALAMAVAAPAGERRPLWRRKLINPDKILGMLAPHVSWCFTRAFLVGSSLPVLLAVHILVTNWGEFSAAAAESLGEDVLKLIGLWFAVQLLAVIVQGLAVKVQGGEVREIGVQIFRMLPRFYCRTSGGFWRGRKSSNMAVQFAPIHFVLVMWAGATIVWWLNGPGTYAYTTGLMFAMASTLCMWMTVNPLEKRWGYTLLTVWTEVPNLQQFSIAALRARLSRRGPSQPLTHRERTWFVWFGLLWIAFTTAWLADVLWKVGVALTGALQGAGAIILIAWMVYGLPIGRPVRRALPLIWNPSARVSVRLVVRVAILLILVIGSFLPYSYHAGGSFKILPVQRYEVHVEIDGGVIRTVAVKEGQWVNKGDVLATIDQREYRKNLETAEAQLASTRAQLSLLRKQIAMLTDVPDIERIQQLEAEVRRLEVVVGNAKRELELTILRSPISGKVITPHIDQKVGEFLKKGDMLAVIEDARTVEVEISVPEGDVPEVRPGAAVTAAPWAYPDRTFSGDVLSVASAASGDGKSTVVRVLARLANPDGLLKSEMTGYAKIGADTKPVWEVVMRRLLRWIKVEVWSWIP